jgi:hypothetical protein
MRIVDTDNFGGDYPDEHFHGHCMPEKVARAIADMLNADLQGPDDSYTASRYYKVVRDDYKLQPGFTP